MRKLTLLTSVLLASSFQTGNVSAQCMNTVNCQTLGYTKTSCTKGGVKCPTGNYWYCPKDTTTPQCSSSYKYTCTGAYQSPSGTACNGLYTGCTCTSGYQWTNGSCQKKEIAWGSCNGLAQNCSIGDILNSDGTCTTSRVSGKTPIGVVIYKSGNCGQALALNDLSNYSWSNANTAAQSYFPSSASETKNKWFLPSSDVFNSQLRSVHPNFNFNGYYWTSSAVDTWTATVFISYGDDGILTPKNKVQTFLVRPAIQF